jgi:hypothetical protein
MTPQTKKIIIWSVSGAAFLTAGYFGINYFVIKDDNGKTKYQLARDAKGGAGAGGGGGAGSSGAGGSTNIDPSSISSSDFPLEINARNKAVVLMQIALKHKWGQDVTIDGRFGDQTRLALINKFPQLFGGSSSPTAAKVYLSLPFTKMEISASDFNKVIAGVNFNSLFASNSGYKSVFNQFQNFNG